MSNIYVYIQFDKALRAKILYNGKIIYLCIFIIVTLNHPALGKCHTNIFFSLYFSILHVFIICYVFNYISEFAILMCVTKIASI